MDHRDHVLLLRQAAAGHGTVWADFGSGQGAFTLALAEILGPSGEIYSVEKNRGKLRRQKRSMNDSFPRTPVHYLQQDFTGPLDIPRLDGLVIANALHFFRKKDRLIGLLKSYLRPCGRLIVVEYNTDKGNQWVPYPFSYPSWRRAAERNGLTNTELVERVPSSFLGEIYSAVSIKGP